MYFNFLTLGKGYSKTSLYIGLHNPLANGGISDYRHILDNSTITYHNVISLGTTREDDMCMFVFTDGGSKGARWSPGDWSDGPCRLENAAMCEAPKVIFIYIQKLLISNKSREKKIIADSVVIQPSEKFELTANSLGAHIKVTETSPSMGQGELILRTFI